MVLQREAMGLKKREIDVAGRDEVAISRV